MLFSSRISASCCTAARRATRGDRLKAFGSSPMVDAMAYSVRLAHLDGHLNMHLHPMVLPILRELAPRYDIRAMRLSREDVGAALRYDSATSRASSGRASSSAPRRLRGAASPRGRHRDRRPRLRHAPDRAHRRALPACADGRAAARPERGVLVYCHPAEGVAPAMAPYERGYDHLGELAALTRARVREAVRAGGWCSSQLRGRRCRGAPRLRLTRVPSSQSASSAGHHGNRELPCTSCNARPNAALGGRGGAQKVCATRITWSALRPRVTWRSRGLRSRGWPRSTPSS